MILNFSDIGSSLGTRELGLKTRNQIVAALNENQKIVFDFTGVEVVSNSFADECFAKLVLFFDFNKVKQNTTFQNTSPFIKTVIANAFKARLSVLHSA